MTPWKVVDNCAPHHSAKKMSDIVFALAIHLAEQSAAEQLEAALLAMDYVMSTCMT